MARAVQVRQEAQVDNGSLPGVQGPRNPGASIGAVLHLGQCLRWLLCLSGSPPMRDPIRIVEGSWSHTCLRVPGHEGEPIKLHLPGVGGCPHCGDPGPDPQKEIDIVSTETLRA